MNKLFVFFGFFCVFAASVAEASCSSVWETRQGYDGRVTRVRVANTECAKTLGRTGNGVYNGRRKGGMIIGALLGGGIAHALGGDAGNVVAGVLGGAQTGTYIGSTFDQDAQVRDQIELNRSRCGAGTYYNTVSHQCEVDEGIQPLSRERPRTDTSGSRTFETTEEAQTYCASQAPGAMFDADTGSCVAPRQQVANFAQPDNVVVEHEAFCEAKYQSCPVGMDWGPIVYDSGRRTCGCR